VKYAVDINRAVSIPYETNVTFLNSPFLDNFTVMGAVIVAEHLTLSCFLYLFSIISACYYTVKMDRM
jgi:hypothetical protein